MKIQFKLATLVVFQLFCGVATADTIGGCSPSSVTKGLYADYVNITSEEYGIYTGLDAALSAIDQAEADYSWGGVTSQDFSFEASDDGTAYYGDLYGKNVNVAYFGLRLSGYFYASTTGDYTFEISFADDAASFTLGSGVAMDCCGSKPLTGNLDEMASVYASGEASSATETVTLTGGVYYPIKVVYYQATGLGQLNMSVTYPDGTKHTDDIDWYSSTDNSSSCPYSVTTTIIWTGTDTETVTVTGSDGDVTVTVEIPETTTTTTDVWTGTDGEPTVVVETPASIFTTSTYWTGSFTSTYTTTGPDGDVTVVVETPEPYTTIPWTGSFTSTYTTTGTDGEPTVVVETPEARTTIPWTGSTTSTYTTTGADGKPTVVIETPEPVIIEEGVTTIILPCTCKEPSTTTTTGDDGKNTVICNIPHSLVSTVVVTEPCTNVAGDVTVTTYTTFTFAAAITANPTETVSPTGAKGNGSGAAAEVASAGNGSESSPQEVSTYEAMGSKNTYTFLAVLSALLWISI
ncbi:hypothetical protein PSN45_003648 [Yamadazyma tenuis]|uniref:uncharacterized protein n=1 Tax=Candida tenuis TaxID=2315449 RepID=UPI0027A0AC27|nr:hypothetical protein PSN45_003648 [Yamadazyma tenuis]